jgi:hypothetical protein
MRVGEVVVEFRPKPLCISMSGPTWDHFERAAALCDDSWLEVRIGGKVLRVNDVEYGAIHDGDHVIVEHEQVTVNGVKRQPA